MRLRETRQGTGFGKGGRRLSGHLCSCMVKEMIGGWRDTLVKELHVTPLFREPSPVVTTTTIYTPQRKRKWRWRGGKTSCLQTGQVSLPVGSAVRALPIVLDRVLDYCLNRDRSVNAPSREVRGTGRAGRCSCKSRSMTDP